MAIGLSLFHSPSCSAAEPKKQYWATSLAAGVDDGILQGLYAAVARGETGWLDVDPQHPIPTLEPGINLILYHVGGNCYVGDDCQRFPSSEPTRDRWGGTERIVDLSNQVARKIVIDDLVVIVRQGDQIAPEGSIVGIHLDNVHRLGAQDLGDVFNDFLKAVDAAKQQGLISRSRAVGYIAKNNPEEFKEALDQKWLEALPLYQINENATLSQDGMLDDTSRIAQRLGKQYCIPVFLKTFGTDVAYTMRQGGRNMDVHVTVEMARRMAHMPSIAGAAWSADEANYHPTVFEQGSAVGPC
jgi:hypothetical protein